MLAFSHRLMHWGSAADARAPAPRISLAFAAADPAFEKAYFPHAFLPMPSLDLRVALLAGQVLKNSSNEHVLTTRTRVSLFYRLFGTMAEVFDRDYCNEKRQVNQMFHLKLPRMSTTVNVPLEVKEESAEEGLTALLDGL
ncbi:unnamed protein product [Prorocentrum cordatum]|uniref:Uncharacterized protein n=1 Tax=Prorocentrum cordatum TaxID=2364126 RepID=A0ABN9TF13_9DINO|nr:unnamed protein product [Polarella glacialis]